MIESETAYDVSVEGATAPITVRVSGVPALSCPSCGDTLHSAEAAERAELLAAKALVERGSRFGSVLRLARRTLGYRAADLAAVLDVTVETISRWENDHYPIDPATWVTLAGLISDELRGSRDTLQRLEAAKQRPEAKSCEIQFDRKRYPLANVICFADRLQVTNAAPARVGESEPTAIPATFLMSGG